jgi:recombination protein RecT
MARSQALTEARQHTVERTRQFTAELDQFAPSIEQALPANIPIDRFKRVLITAVSMNPDLLYADRRTLYTASVKCAADGLLPDGRDAALVIHNTKVKMRNAAGLDEEFRIDAVSYMPMLAGIRRRMQNSGEVLSAEAEVVCRNDRFKYSLGDTPYIEHEPPPLGEDRGNIIGAYAIIRLKSGEVIRDVMDVKRIEAARAQGRQKDGLMWTKFYDEGCKKTVMRRASKQVPQSSEMVRLLDRDDEPPLIEDTPLTGLPAPPQLQRIEPPSPPPAIEQDNDPGYTYAVIDPDGVEHTFATSGTAAKALTLLFAEAARRGVKAMGGARESNEGVLQELGADDPQLHAEVLEDYNTRYAAAKDAERRAKAPPPPPAPEPEPPPPEPAAAAPAPSAPAATSMTHAPAAGPSSTGDDDDYVDRSAGDESMLIPTDKAVRNGKVNWSAWTAGLFLPRLRQMRDGTDLAFLLGDNDENLTAARAALDPATLRNLEAAITQQWKVIG